mgnify:CR=1 FL=1
MPRALITVMMVTLAASGCARLTEVMPNRLFAAPDGVGPADLGLLEQVTRPRARGGVASGVGSGAEDMSQDPPADLRTSRAWRQNLTPGIPYINLQGRPVPVYSDIALGTSAGTLGPGEGGYIQTCRDDAPICRIGTAQGDAVWVDVTRLAGISG